MTSSKSQDQDRGPGAEKVELEKRLDKNQKVAENADKKSKDDAPEAHEKRVK